MDFITLGNLLASTIVEFIDTLETAPEWNLKNLEEKYNTFLIKLHEDTVKNYWFSMIEQQFQEISKILSNPDLMKPKADFLTPKQKAEEFQNVFLFSPYINEEAKIPCTLVSCKSTFMHKGRLQNNSEYGNLLTIHPPCYHTLSCMTLFFSSKSDSKIANVCLSVSYENLK